MPYLEKNVVNGVTYIRIVDHYRNQFNQPRKKIISSLGPISKYDDGKPLLFERLKAGFADGSFIPTANNLISIDISNSSFNSLNLKNFGFLCLEAFFDMLGIPLFLANYKIKNKFNFDINGITELLVLGRILQPDSKLATFEQRNRYHEKIVDDNTILEHVYRSLSVLNKISIPLQKSIFNYSKKIINRHTDIVYYDLTNYYFEVLQNDSDSIDENTGELIKGLRKKGVSKENRKSPIVQMGLFIDDKGIPICYKLFPGNTIDKVTLRPMLKEYIHEYNLGKIIVVADRIINSQPNLNKILENGDGYVISKSIPHSKKEFQDWVKEDEGYTWLSENQTYKYKSKIIDKEYIDENGVSHKYKEKIVVYWSKKQRDHAISESKAFQNYLNAVVENPDKLKDKQRKSVEFLKTTYIDRKTNQEVKIKKEYEIDYEKIEKQISLLGYYCITSSEIEKEDLEIVNIYHGLSRIEDSFRVIKSDFEGRPVYVSTPEHINAHFLICFISLVIIRLLQIKIQEQNPSKLPIHHWESGMSTERIVKALNDLTSHQLNEIYYLSTVKKNDAKTILEALGIINETTVHKKEYFKNIKSLIKNKITKK